MLSSISREKAEGSCLNLALQFFSRHSSAFRTVSGSSSLVSAARTRICLDWVISVSGFATAVEERAVGHFLEDRDGGVARGMVVKAAAQCANVRRINSLIFVVSVLTDRRSSAM